MSTLYIIDNNNYQRIIFKLQIFPIVVVKKLSKSGDKLSKKKIQPFIPKSSCVLLTINSLFVKRRKYTYINRLPSVCAFPEEHPCTGKNIFALVTYFALFTYFKCARIWKLIRVDLFVHVYQLINFLSFYLMLYRSPWT